MNSPPTGLPGHDISGWFGILAPAGIPKYTIARPWRILLACAFVLPALALAQETYPSRPIRIIVPTASGGGSDNGARLLAPELTKRLGRSVVVENRPGAGTILGSEVVAKSAPDGYTLLMSPSTLATNPASYKKLPYDALRDFAPITQTLYVANMILAHPSLPARSIKELIALAKARPGEILYASAGHGTNAHLTMELFASMAGIRFVHIPYKGSGPGFVDTIAGRVALMASSSMTVVLPHVRSGRLRALACTAAQRIAVLPDVPTVAEAGLPGYESVQWSGLLAPAGTPREILTRLHSDVVAVLGEQAQRQRLASENFEVVASSPEEFFGLIKSEIVKWARVAKIAGIQPE